MAHRLLIVEDRDSLRRLLERALRGEGYDVVSVATEADGVASATEPFALALTDLQLPDGNGLEVVRAFTRHQPRTPVVVLTAFGSVTTAVDAMKAGATDFLEKPLELDDLFALVGSLVGEHEEEPERFEAGGDAPAIIGRHPRLKAALRLLEKVAPTETTVLVTGPSGTGKELFAQALHSCSKRRQGPFVAVNCAAIPDALMENELFGHEKGAFTGADRRQLGRFEQAEGGTLFLDEIGELKLEVQAKVLRVLEAKTFERVGGGRPRRADVRIVAATNRDLHAMVRDGTFRQDLLYRLDVFPIALPTLAERRSDVPALCRHLATQIAERLGLERPSLSPDVLDRLQAEDWPGNVRQLANLLERALILADDGQVRLEDLEVLLGAARATPDDAEALRHALRQTDGDKQRAAEILGVSYRTLQRRVREHDLEGYPRYRR
ncbi:MAG: sigma-54 dependent transcriptional regulator [Acidobacteriota bacterium]